MFELPNIDSGLMAQHISKEAREGQGQGFVFPRIDGGLMVEQIKRETAIQDPRVMPHVASILAAAKHSKFGTDIVHISNIVKQTDPQIDRVKPTKAQKIIHNVPLIHSKQPKTYYLRRFSQDNDKLQWAGVGLTRQQTHMIDIHLHRLAEENNAVEIRFWGRILGSAADYYIVQGRLRDGLVDQAAAGQEKQGQGANFYTYWVSNNILEMAWTQLPLVTTAMIKTARKIKVLLSGNLAKPILSHPPFPGQERHYLKAQLVRMTSSLQLVPKGIYKPNDDNPKITQLEQQVKLPQYAQMCGLEAWQHKNLNLLHLGRCTHYIDPATPEDQLQQVTAELAQKDPQIERLRGITEDKLPEGDPLGVENIWQLRQCGDSQVFNQGEGSVGYGVVVIKNIFWPGWVTIGYKGGFANFYNGFGHKSVQPAYSSLENKDLQEEGVQGEDYHQPNPKNAPVVVVAAQGGEQPAPQQ